MGPYLQDTWHLLGIHSKHCQYEKSASRPSLFRTLFGDQATKPGGGPLRSVRPQRNAAPQPAAGGVQGPVLAMSYATFSLPCSDDTSPSPFRAFQLDTRRLSAQGGPS